MGVEPSGAVVVILIVIIAICAGIFAGYLAEIWYRILDGEDEDD